MLAAHLAHDHWLVELDLRSNGIDGTSTRIVTTERADPSYAFAEGINPFRDPDWMAARQAAFRDLTGQF